MRKRMVAGNWKMNGSVHDTPALLTALKQEAGELSTIDVVVFPTAIHLFLAEKLLKGTGIAYGAQNIYLGKSGAYTGEVSGTMIRELGCTYVLIGHSERRAIFQEDLTLLANKFTSALEAGLRPILCIGETIEQRQAGQTERVISEQLESVVKTAGIQSFKQAVIAYEPVWAIGTGLTATPEQAQDAHAFIRQSLAKHDETIANKMQILYGGSVKADNAAGLFAMSDIDGALVGGASLEAKSFLEICNAALESSNSLL